jgi:hypothetical protein
MGNTNQKPQLRSLVQSDDGLDHCTAGSSVAPHPLLPAEVVGEILSFDGNWHHRFRCRAVCRLWSDGIVCFLENALTAQSRNGHWKPEDSERIVAKQILCKLSEMSVSVRCSIVGIDLTYLSFTRWSPLWKPLQYIARGYSTGSSQASAACDVPEMELITSCTPQLKSLHLSGGKVDSKAAAALVSVGSGLASLSLESCDMASDDFRLLLETSSGLTSFNGAFCSGVTISVMAALAKLPFRTLRLGGQQITDECVDVICSIPTLEDLRFHNAMISDRAARYLSRVSTLKTLHLLECSLLTEEAMSRIGRMVWLNELSVSSLSNSSAEWLASIRKLATLTLTDSPELTFVNFASFACRNVLISLTLRDCGKLTDACVTQVAGLTQLESLELSACPQVSDTSLKLLAKLPRLKRLRMWHSRATDSVLESLVKFSHVSDLDLSLSDSITDSGVAQLTKLVSLERLCLKGCVNLTDISAEALLHNSSLKTLELAGCFRISPLGAMQLEHRQPKFAFLDIAPSGD